MCHLRILKKQRLPLRSLDELLLHHCCTLAWEHQTLALPNPSVGALIVAPNEDIIGVGVHILVGSPHAEILAMKEAYYTLTQDKQILNLTESKDIHQYLLNNHQGIFTQCALYVSLEPCNHQGKTPPCAALIAELQFAKVCIATTESHQLAKGGLDYLLSKHINASVNLVLEHYAKSLILPFETMRTKGRFVLFKLAQRLNGDYKNGRISCQDSQIFTHNQRSVCDYICISGATLRTDNPQLNSRYATTPYDSTKAPQVLVFSHTQNKLKAENKILENRVHFSADIRDVRELKGFVIIEGGYYLLHSMRSEIDMLLLMQSPHTTQDSQTQTGFDESFSLIHQNTLGSDVALWLV